jgi:hypothetical protein
LRDAGFQVVGASDAELGMAWWNALTKRERAHWAALAGTGRVVDAWGAMEEVAAVLIASPRGLEREWKNSEHHGYHASRRQEWNVGREWRAKVKSALCGLHFQTGAPAFQSGRRTGPIMIHGGHRQRWLAGHNGQQRSPARCQARRLAGYPGGGVIWRWPRQKPRETGAFSSFPCCASCCAD